MSVYVAFYKGRPRPGASLRERVKYLFDGAIRLITRSPYSHCAPIRSATGCAAIRGSVTTGSASCALFSRGYANPRRAGFAASLSPTSSAWITPPNNPLKISISTFME